MKKWQIAVSILLVFALGTTAGAYGAKVIFKKRVKRALQTEGTPGIKVIQRMVGRMDLSEAQRASLSAILEENNQKWETIWQEYGPKINSLYETVIEETKKMLTPEQQEELEQMSANVQSRLPPRTFSKQRSSGRPGSSASPRSYVPPEGTIGPEGTAPPEGNAPPETSGAPSMTQPFYPRSDANRTAGIIEQLKIEEEKAADVRSIIEADIKRQQALMDEFQKSQDAAEEKFRKEMADGQLATEKKLESLLTPEQMEIYRQLMSREEPRRDDFGFDVPGGDPMENRDYKQQAPSTPLDGDPDKSRRGLVPIIWNENTRPHRHIDS